MLLIIKLEKKDKELTLSKEVKIQQCLEAAQKNKRIKKVKWSKTTFLHRAGVRSPDTNIAHKLLKKKKKRLSGTEALALSTPGLIADWRQLHRRVALKAGDTHTGISHSSLS